MEKTCIKCLDEKELTEFTPRPDAKDGRRNRCLECTASYNKKYVVTNSVKLKSNQKIYLENNPEIAEKCKVSQKKRYLLKREEILEKQRENYKKDPSKKKIYSRNNMSHILKRNKEWRDNSGREKYLISAAKNKEWVQENKDKVRATKKVYVRIRRKNDLNFRISSNLRRKINHILKGDLKAGSFVNDLGCDMSYLIKHLESKFKDGMSWKNYGFGKSKWNIDHITPLSYFDLSDRSQFLKASHFTNLQPLWHIENITKGNRYIG